MRVSRESTLAFRDKLAAEVGYVFGSSLAEPLRELDELLGMIPLPVSELGDDVVAAAIPEIVQFHLLTWITRWFPKFKRSGFYECDRLPYWENASNTLVRLEVDLRLAAMSWFLGLFHKIQKV